MNSSIKPTRTGSTSLNATPVSLRAVKGGFVPADAASKRALAASHVKIGDTVLASLDAPRNPGFHRLAYKFAQVCRHNIDDFAGVSEHDVLKRLQLKTGMGCEEVEVQLSDVWSLVSEVLLGLVGPDSLVITEAVAPFLEGETVKARQPKSLRFGEMSQAEFRLMFSAFCRHVSEAYWPNLTELQVGQLAGLMPEDLP